ncbi:MAG: YraN family protein, partial [Spirochaeta sp.]
EGVAVDYLSSIGHRILQKNYKRRTGEVDIISTEGDVIVCTEVKTWFGTPAEDLAHSISLLKQQRIIRTAQVFLYENPQLRQCSVRFDVIHIGSHTGVCHYPDAFQGAW